jgi:hypothetical protein
MFTGAPSTDRVIGAS